MTSLRYERETVRKIYMAFKSGAGLQQPDVSRLLGKAGTVLSNNQLRELGRDSDRGASINLDQLYALVSTWADEQQALRPANRAGRA